jgi:hypothetical protein
VKRLKVFSAEYDYQLQDKIDKWLDREGETIEIVDTQLRTMGSGLGAEIIVVITYLIKVKD